LGLRFIDNSSFNYKPNTNWLIETSEFSRTVRINNIGLRGEDFHYFPDKKYILMVGDSFTFGEGVNSPDSAPEILNRLLEQYNKDLLVINAGRTGASIVQYKHYIDKYKSIVRPKLVIMTVFVGNDFMRLFLGRFSLQLKIDEYLDKIISGYQEKKASNKKTIQNYYDKKFFGRDNVNRVNVEENVFYDTSLLRSAFNRPNIINDTLVDFDQYVFIDNMNFIKRIKENLEYQGIDFILVLVPVACQVNQKYLDIYREAGFNLDDRLLSISPLQDAIVEYCKSKDIDCIDILPLFRKAEDNVYYLKDIHCTPLGYKIIAQAISDYINSHLDKFREILEN